MTTDHKGKKFGSKIEMVKAYGIPYDVYYERIKAGYSLKDALESTHVDDNSVYDHLGNKYTDLDIMCDAWDISKEVYLNNYAKGLTKEECLTGRTVDFPKKEVDVDALYRQIEDLMAEQEETAKIMLDNIKAILYPDGLCRINNPQKRKIVKDHTGKVHKTEMDMCQAWGVNYTTFRRRLRYHWSVYFALTHEENHPFVDHAGNVYTYYRQLANAYGLTPAGLEKRMNSGMNLKDALTM